MCSLIRSLFLPALMAMGSLQVTAAPSQTTAKAAHPDITKSDVTKLTDQAFAEMQKKSFGTALPLYEQALVLAPTRPETWNEYAICLRHLRRFPAAVRAGWRALQLDGGHTPQAWNAQANTLMEAREWSAAEACLDKVEPLQKDHTLVAKAWLALAFRKLAAGESDGVVAACRRAIKLDANDALAWIDLGQALVCTGGDSKEAMACFEKGQVLAEQHKDVQQADFAGQLIRKVKAGESIWPPLVPGQSWQLIPGDLLAMPEKNASLIPLPALVEHRYCLDDGGALALSLPEAWTDAADKARPEHLFTIRFTMAGEPDFKAFFSPIKVGNPLGVKATAEDVAKRLLAGSAEKELTPRELMSPTLKGYWLLSTDKRSEGKAPAKGEYRHLLTFLLDVDRMQCVGTVLTNAKGADVVDPCVAAFSSARKLPPPRKR